MTYLRNAFASLQAALWAILSLASAMIIASAILQALGLTMFPANTLVFLAATAILFTRGIVDHRVTVSRLDTMACPSASAALEAGFAHVIHTTLAVLTLGLSLRVLNRAGNEPAHWPSPKVSNTSPPVG